MTSPRRARACRKEDMGRSFFLLLHHASSHILMLAGALPRSLVWAGSSVRRERESSGYPTTRGSVENRSHIGNTKICRRKALFPTDFSLFLLLINKISELPNFLDFAKILPTNCSENLLISNKKVKNRWEMKLFLYTFRSIRNRTFIGAKMEALLTVTWWLGSCDV